ncbi:hypothetical protein [Xenorhabdus szentirmaii]|uniref:Uncharacterized protein n=1 Tax=Xenorhabdus szentirmaii DSM 16338 TaxID=1427518 RepID=W1IVI3_9GAMM|nr:hypothetical protein [Xenorhabdus szentirmaii]PHM32864.1 hypothetical protein Xsze_03614 [Xenorhabdus szentirmaii DSM 16338]PHM40817.1 hypothetical protein Xszus_00492 [Xenorhabdus szentirmaii]CDL81843.1 conserved hypothetical protein [Xenorhabdus szentirmaii DSM 16338]
MENFKKAKTLKVSESYLFDFWALLNNEINSNHALFKLDLNDITNIEILVKQGFLPAYNKHSISWKNRLKESYKYKIKYGKENNLAYYYRCGLPQMKLPSVMSVKEFYILVWKCMFGEESYEANDIDDYDVIDQYNTYDWYRNQ